MPTFDFTQAAIIVRSYTDLWGPFSFNFTNSIPSGTSITAATVRTYKNDTSAETTSSLVETGSTTVASPSVAVKFQYPGSSNRGYHDVFFDLTFNSGAKHRFHFGYVFVE